MDFPSGCFLWREILQQFRYLGASGVSFFCRSCAGSCRVFSPSSRFSSEIFHILRMLPAVFFPAISAFFSSRSIFSACFVQAPAVFFPRNLDFSSGIFHILRMLPAVFFISHSGIFRFLKHFFLSVLCRLLPCFSSVIPIFIRNLSHFADAACRFLSAIPVFLGASKTFFSASLVQAPAVFFLRHPDFSSGIFCILRMPLAVFFPAIPALFPLFLPFPLMENLLLSCFCTDFLHGTDAHAFARA